MGEREQQSLGVQSYRGDASMEPMDLLKDNQYALDLFNLLFANEQRLCARHAVFYHSYSHAALLYETRATLAAVLSGFNTAHAPLPRLNAAHFVDVPNAAALMNKVRTEWGPEKSDHNAGFRRVGISAMCSLVAKGPECCMQVAFFEGYSCKKIAFRQVLEQELQEATSAPTDECARALDEIITASAKYGLDTSILGGHPSPSGHAGHILQIFVRRDLVDRLCYAAKPYGEIDEERFPLSAWLNGSCSFAWGQARLLAHPKYFMNRKCVQMFVISADPTFQSNRGTFQTALQST